MRSTNIEKLLPVSVIILHHVGHSNVEQTIRSVTFANEILVVDHNSQFDWTALRKSVPQLKIIPFKDEKISDFATHRNWAMTLASSEWVFFVDSDEVFVSEDLQSFSELVMQQTVKAAWVERQDYFLGKKLSWGEAGRQFLIRIMYRPASRFAGSVHETAQIDGVTTHLKIKLKHLAHKSISEFLTDTANYAYLEAQSRYTQGKTPSAPEIVIFPIGKLLHNLFLKLGVLDGWRGVVYGVAMSWHSWVMRATWWELTHSNKGRKKI